MHCKIESSGLLLSKLFLRRVVQRRGVFLQTSHFHPASNSNEILSDNEEELIFNSLVGGKKHWKRHQRVEQLIEKSQRQVLAQSTPNVPLTLDFLSPEIKSKLLGGLDAKEQGSPLATEDLSKLALHLKEDTDVQVKKQDKSLEEEFLADFMTSTDHDPGIPASTVPCGGCGALLHCQDPAYPGFIPFECFEGVSTAHLRAQICQRCYILKNYKKALQVEVSSDDYPKILKQIKEKRALVVLIVDLVDFPCSIWPHLNEIIGMNRPVCVVGNKVDLLPNDGKSFLERIKDSLKTEVMKVAGIRSKNIKHVAVVSAKTGYGIEQLINSLHKSWSVQGDVYLVGCTNVGKSSLFNALLDSDYCKVQASELVQRATISHWPGTTLNLLKFPIMRPSPKLLYNRTVRLKAEQKIEIEKAAETKEKLRTTRDLEFATLTASVSKTYEIEKPEVVDPFTMPHGQPSNFKPSVGIDTSDKEYAAGRWCYDTPGVVYPEQVINILTEEELEIVLPTSIIRPQYISLKEGQSFFLAGLGRIDYLEGSGTIILTIFASTKLPLTVCWTRSADSIYKSYLGTDNFLVPTGDSKRLKAWPGLKSAPAMHFESEGWTQSVADILLSSAGWVSVMVPPNNTAAVLQAHTPLGRGIYVRQPSMLPFAVTRKGRRIERTPMYEEFRPLLMNN